MKTETQWLKNFWNTAKEILGGKFIVIQAYNKRKEKSQISK